MGITLKDDYEKLLKIKENHITPTEIDTSHENFLAPTTLIPLIHHARKYDKQIYCNDHTCNYMNRIINEKDTSSTSFISNNSNTKLFMNLPMEHMQRQKEESNAIFVEKIDNSYGGEWFQRYLVEELTNNIYEHAYQRGTIETGINYAQVYPKQNWMDICIFDAGKTIAGNYEEHNQPSYDDCHAIEKALSGTSTGHSEKVIYERGSGIRTIIKKLITENKGEALIASRDAYLHIQNGKEFTYNLGRRLNGTLISLRLKPNHVTQFTDPGEFTFQNPYNYIEEELL